jgi:hypothetical protein
MRPYPDANWLDIAARVEASGARVECAGPWLRTDEIAAFTGQLIQMQTSLSGAAELACMEPNLNIKVQCKSLGHLDVIISITPDHMTQSHVFNFALDQSYLPSAIADCRQFLTIFPIVGSTDYKAVERTKVEIEWPW